jgi:L-threonylcarbamoyladenylate synthase
LIVHVTDVAAARALTRWNALAERLAARFWPGALTLVLPRPPASPLSLLIGAGGDTVALRVPGHPIAQALLQATGLPVAAPSANRAGRVSPTTADHVEAELDDRLALIIDGGACPIGIESTVVDVSGAKPVLLRPGGLERAALEAEVGPLAGPAPIAAPTAGPAPSSPMGLRSPGQLGSHYAPSRPLRLDALDVAPDEALLAFGPAPPAGAARCLNLSPKGDLTEAAANLFAMLRALDRADHRAIAVMPVPGAGLGEAIRDRLRRAAAPR